jgi:hypothetical protein
MVHNYNIKITRNTSWYHVFCLLKRECIISETGCALCYSLSTPIFGTQSVPSSINPNPVLIHLLLVEDVGEVAATTVLAILHGSHEDTGTASVAGALASKALDLAIRVDLVVLEDSQLGLLALVLDLLGGGVHLLLALLGHTTTKAEDQVEGGLLLDVVVRKSAAILELLSGEDQTLLVRGNALLVLDLGLDIVNGIGALDLESDGLAREGLDEDLHLER